MSLEDDRDRLRRRRSKTGEALTEKLRERDKVRDQKRRKKKRDPKTDERERELDREIAKLRAEEKDLTRRIKALRRRREKLGDKLQAVLRKIKLRKKRVVVKPGAPHWGGSEDILERECDPVAKRHGIPKTSGKRPASHPLSQSNPGSDHNEANVWASASDYGTYDGAGLARAIAAALGISGYSTGSYAVHYIERDGHTYRVQILWAVSGHFNHVHVGIALVD